VKSIFENLIIFNNTSFETKVCSKRDYTLQWKKKKNSKKKNSQSLLIFFSKKGGRKKTFSFFQKNGPVPDFLGPSGKTSCGLLLRGLCRAAGFGNLKKNPHQSCVRPLPTLACSREQKTFCLFSMQPFFS
jgi:hypothetical protein